MTPQGLARNVLGNGDFGAPRLAKALRFITDATFYGEFLDFVELEAVAAHAPQARYTIDRTLRPLLVAAGKLSA